MKFIFCFMANPPRGPFTQLPSHSTPVFSAFYQKVKLATHDSQCMMGVTEEELGLRQSPRRSLTTAYFIKESLVALRRRVGTRRRFRVLLNRTYDIALFEVEWRKSVAANGAAKSRQPTSFSILPLVAGANIRRRGRRAGRPTTLASSRCPLQP